MSIQKKIKAIRVESEKKIMDMAQQEFDEIVKPWLIKKGYRFSAGMGTWAIWDKQDHYVSLANIPMKIINFLEIEVDSGNSIGNMLKDFDGAKDEH